MHPRTGFVTQRGTDLTDCLDAAADASFDYVEILMDGADHRAELATRTDRITTMLEDRGLDILVHLPFPIDLGSPHDHQRCGGVEEMRACIELAGTLGAEKGVIHPTATAWGPAWPAETLRSNVYDSLETLAETADTYGVELCAENIFESIHTIDEMPTLLDRTGVSMTLDTGHARVSGYDAEDTAAFVREHADRISHVHLNDTRRPADEHLPFGAGDIDFETVLGGFPDGWDGTLSLEVATDDIGYIVESKRRLDALGIPI